MSFRVSSLAASFLAALVVSTGAQAQPAEPPAKGSPLPRCVLYSSVRLTPQGTMRCSYQCGDRIIIRGGYNSCSPSASRPAPGES